MTKRNKKKTTTTQMSTPTAHSHNYTQPKHTPHVGNYPYEGTTTFMDKSLVVGVVDNDNKQVMSTEFLGPQVHEPEAVNLPHVEEEKTSNSDNIFEVVNDTRSSTPIHGDLSPGHKQEALKIIVESIEDILEEDSSDNEESFGDPATKYIELDNKSQLPSSYPEQEESEPKAAPSNYEKVKNFFTGISNKLSAGATKVNQAWEFVKPGVIWAGKGLFALLHGIATLLYIGAEKLYNIVTNIPTNRADAKLRAQEFKTYAYESVKAAPAMAQQGAFKAYEYMPSQARITTAFASIQQKANSFAGYSTTAPLPQPGESKTSIPVTVTVKSKNTV